MGRRSQSHPNLRGPAPRSEAAKAEGEAQAPMKPSLVQTPVKPSLQQSKALAGSQAEGGGDDDEDEAAAAVLAGSRPGAAAGAEGSSSFSRSAQESN